MQLGGLDRARRERAFHHNHDELITVDDLWEAWFASEERSWTTVDMVNWLENTVRLPQYATIFIEMEIDGRALPRSAYREYSLVFFFLHMTLYRCNSSTSIFLRLVIGLIMKRLTSSIICMLKLAESFDIIKILLDTNLG